MTCVRQYAVIAALIMIAGCDDPTVIEPEPTAEHPEVEAPGMQQLSAVSTINGVKVIASAEGWWGPASIREEVTPFRVHIDNDSKATDVRVEYENLYLIDQDGERLQALPPFKVEGEAPALKLGPGYAVVEPRWEAEAFEVYDIYDPVFDEEIVVYEGAWDEEPDYYASYYTYWDETDLPTPDMLAYALPEGVVKAGGSVDGWVYFEKIEDEGGDIEFRADLVEADSGLRIGQINLPFDVDELEF